MVHRARIVAVFGPTAVGKTDVCLELAERLRRRGEDPVAVSADALQVYQGLDVLTAKPSAGELERLEHRLVSTVPVSEEFSAGRFAALAHAEIDSLLAEGRRPIVVGGTGLYLRAALAEVSFKHAPPPGLRKRWERYYDEHGAEATHAALRERDADVAATIRPNDRKRVVRALELAEMGDLELGERSELWSERTRHPTLLAGLTMRREQLYRRIDARVDRMIERGAAEEVGAAAAAGASVTAVKALGFAELAAHAEGRVSREQAAEAIKRRTRNYARRQLTWMRKLPAVLLIDRTDQTSGQVAERIADSLDLRAPASG